MCHTRQSHSMPMSDLSPWSQENKTVFHYEPGDSNCSMQAQWFMIAMLDDEEERLELRTCLKSKQTLDEHTQNCDQGTLGV